MQQKSDKVEQVPKRYGQNDGGMADRLKQIAMPLVVSVVVSFLMFTYLFSSSLVSKKDFTANIQGMTDIINKSKADLAQTVTSVQNTVNAIPASIAGQVTAGVNQGIASVTSQLSSIQAISQSASDKATQATNTVNSQNTQIDALTKQLTDAETRIKALESKTTGSSSSPSSSSPAVVSDTLNAVTASIASYSYVPSIYGYSGAGAIPFTTLADNSSSAMFQLIVSNNTSRTIKDIVVVLSFGVVDTSTGASPNMVTTNIALNSQSFIPRWTSATPTPSNYLSFYTGGFGFSSFSQQAGEVTYINTLTIPTNANLLPNKNYLLFPIIKVQSFSY